MKTRFHGSLIRTAEWLTETGGRFHLRHFNTIAEVLRALGLKGMTKSEWYWMADHPEELIGFIRECQKRKEKAGV